MQVFDLLRGFSKYLILNAIVRWKCFLSFFSWVARCLCIQMQLILVLALHRAIFLGLCISSDNFFVESLVFSVSSVNRDHFTLPSPMDVLLFILFSCLTAPVRTSSVWKRGTSSVCLVPDLGGNAFSL